MRSLPYKTKQFSKKNKISELFFESPKDTDALLNLIKDFQYEKDEAIPYWADLWPSSDALFEYLSELKIKNEINICDLGCGLGVISTIMAQYNTNVFSLDISKDACIFTHYNMIKNNFNPKVICSDWRNPPFSEKFDIIVAADILYEKRWVTPVINFIKIQLKPYGKFIIADPRRDPWNYFKKQLKKNNLEIISTDLRNVNYGKTTVEIIEGRIKY